VKNLIIFLLIIKLPFSLLAGNEVPYAIPSVSILNSIEDTVKKSYKDRRLLVTGGNIAFWTGSLLVLNHSWYDQYERTGFHFFNDMKEWQQMDKVGHIWTSYQVSRHSAKMWNWAGYNDKSSIILGGVSGIAYLSLIEILDGYSSGWGFSWGDMGANFIGSGLYTTQELLWKQQKLSVKFSFFPDTYPEELKERQKEILGTGPVAIFKDYNAQTYWLSANIHSFFPETRLPKWLNIAVGYSAEGMLGGLENRWTNDSGNEITRFDIPRYRQYFLSPDIDLTKIPTKSGFLKTAFFVLDMIKIPAPSLEFNTGKGFKWHWIYF